MSRNDRKFLASWFIFHFLFSAALYLISILSESLFRLEFFQNWFWVYVISFGSLALISILIAFGLPSLQVWIQKRSYQTNLPHWWRQTFSGLVIASVLTWLSYHLMLNWSNSQYQSYSAFGRFLSSSLLILVPFTVFRLSLGFVQSFAFPARMRGIWISANIIGYGLLVLYVFSHLLFVNRFVPNVYEQPQHYVFLLFASFVFSVYANYLEADSIAEYFIDEGIPKMMVEDDSETPFKLNPVENLGA